MVNPKTELLGADDLKRLLAKAGKDIVPIMAASLYASGNFMMMESQRQVPFRFGGLKASGRVFEPQIRGTIVTVDLGYGGDAKAYALVVHESDGPFRNGKKSHYLSDPVNNGDGVISKILQSKLGRLG